MRLTWRFLHICVSKQTIIDSGTTFNESLIEIYTLLFNKIHLNSCLESRGQLSWSGCVDMATATETTLSGILFESFRTFYFLHFEKCGEREKNLNLPCWYGVLCNAWYRNVSVTIYIYIYICICICIWYVFVLLKAWPYLVVHPRKNHLHQKQKYRTLF